MTTLPKIIQGGMGAGVSSWRLAHAVSSLGQLGVVSGIALDVILTRRLQDGDPDGSTREALDAFPIRRVAERILEKYFVSGGRKSDEPYAPTPMHTEKSSPELDELCIAGNFVEVFLARIGHSGPVGVNYLEKIQLPHLPSIYGAMLAGAAVVIMGAGIATKIPGVLDCLSRGTRARYELSVTGAIEGNVTELSFDPALYAPDAPATLDRPQFLSIISSNVLATTMVRRSNGRVDGFIIESPTAGGHNAPPRGKLQLDDAGQPVYGDKDSVDLDRIRDLGLPFWLAGGFASHDRLEEALRCGASGIQVGTAFALCEESGLEERYRTTLIAQSLEGKASVFTDPQASPTGFPFKVAQLDNTLSDAATYAARTRVCDLGFLREAYRRDDGRIGFRCPAEPESAWVRKGGDPAATEGRRCLCNALLANIGHPQVRRDGTVEQALVTAGDGLNDVARFVRPGRTTYSARDVIDELLGRA